MFSKHGFQKISENQIQELLLFIKIKQKSNMACYFLENKIEKVTPTVTFLN